MSAVRRIAVVGAGVIGTHHGRVISRLADPSLPVGEFLFEPTLVSRESSAPYQG